MQTNTNVNVNEGPTCGCGGGGGGCGGAARERRWADADGEHIDVRGFSPPQPLILIVRLIEDIDASGRPRAVIAHLDRDPLMLYPELAQRGWAAQALPTAPDEAVRLKLEREPAPA
jgi:hypothetical protein